VAELRTHRLLLRQWRDTDLDPWAAMNADPEVMEHFPSVMTREESAAFMTRIRAAIDHRGWGLWAVSVVDGAPFIGFIGLQPVVDPVMPVNGVEVGWRLARSAWGHGYASEGARAALAYAFEELSLPEVISFTSTTNERSQAVMRRIGLTRDPADDFDHPKVPEGSRLRRHVLYRLRRDAFTGAR
jgi:RimJ/RimL family protein N-acetyltransferase